ncbi:TPA: hypothetical protein ACIEAF_006473, partial [Pseudomonas aeruginosa]
QQFGDNYLKGLEERAAFLTQAYEDAGWQGSVTAGVEGGRFAAELVGVLTAVSIKGQIYFPYSNSLSREAPVQTP